MANEERELLIEEITRKVLKNLPLESTQTLLELQKLGQQIEHLTDSMKELKGKLDGTVTQKDLSSVQKDVDELKSGQTWVVRAIIGSVITAVLAILWTSKS